MLWRGIETQMNSPSFVTYTVHMQWLDFYYHPCMLFSSSNNCSSSGKRHAAGRCSTTISSSCTSSSRGTTTFQCRSTTHTISHMVSHIEPVSQLSVEHREGHLAPKANALPPHPPTLPPP